MKKIFFLSAMAMSVLLWSCSNESDQDPGNNAAATTPEEQVSKEETPSKETAVEEVEFVCSCETSLQVKKDDGYGWGSKVLTWQNGVLTGDTVTIEKNGKKREYSEVKLVDGSVGFLNNWCIVRDAKRGVMLSDATIYKKPDVMALSDVKVKAGEFIAVGNEEIGGYKEITYKVGDAKKTGWIKEASHKYSFEDVDLAVAKMISQAEKLEGEAKAAAIQNIIDNSDFSGSIFYQQLVANQAPSEDLIEDAVDAIETVTDEYEIEDIESPLE